MNITAQNQHYVPCFILRKFTTDKKNKIWVYDKKKSRKFQTNIKNVASEKGFYNISADNITATFEPYIADLECRAAVLINKIIKDKALFSLSPKDKELFSTFAALQFVRTRGHREKFASFVNDLHEKIQKMGFRKEQIPGKGVPPTKDALKFHTFLSVKDCNKLAPFFFAKYWLLFETPPGSHFFISDNPITLQNHLDFGFYGNLGLGLKGIEIYFPISPNYCLAFYCPSHYDTVLDAYNKYSILRENIPDINTFFDPTLIESYKSGFEAGTAIKMTKENIENLNSLQVIFSEQYVYSIHNDFALIDTMVKSNSDFRGGLKLKSI